MSANINRINLPTMDKAKRCYSEKKESVKTRLKKTGRTFDNLDSAGRGALHLIEERPALSEAERDETLGGSRHDGRSLFIRARHIADSDGLKHLGGKIRSARRKVAGHYGVAGGRALPAGVSLVLPHQSVVNKGDLVMSSVEATNAVARLAVYEGERFRRHGHDYSKGRGAHLIAQQSTVGHREKSFQQKG